jgi:formylglycine-generating enzyme required for sulfatase activity/uncharacterized caspase-like protein
LAIAAKLLTADDGCGGSMLRVTGLLAGLLLVLMSIPLPAFAEKRAALVIGNGAYVKVPRLPNPTNDSAAMAGLLRTAGFDVVEEKTDLRVDAMRRVLRDFSEHVRDADIAVVFYAGHGMEMNGVNYLIPVDATLARDVDVEDEAISLDRVIRTIEPVRRLQLVILDACRDNPFLRSMRRTVISRSVRSGHGDIDEKTLPPNTLIAFAQKAGATAEDGTSSNSPYTTALLKHLPTPGLDVELALRRVRDEVLQATRNRQEPFKYGSLGGAELPLVPAAATSPPTARPTTPQKLSEAAEAWALIKDTNNVSILEEFIERYGDTFFATLARARVDELKKQQVAVVVPQPKAPVPASQPAVAMPPTPPPGRCDGVETPVGNVRRCLKPKDSFRDCPTCPEMVVVPAGTFSMGSPAIEPDRYSYYEAQVRVTIAAPFSAGKYAVTFDEWDACVADGGCNGYKPADRGWGRGKRPVINVDWDDAKAYAAWLSRKTGKTYRLLSEAEREYVTRAGTTTPFWWGSSITPKQANYDGSVDPYNGGGSKGEYRQRTVHVDSFEPNPWGLYNVHGNVWEWTEDCWNDSNTGNPGDGRARTTGACFERMVRGGSWVDGPRRLRSANRLWYRIDGRGDNQGFRLARTLNP